MQLLFIFFLLELISINLNVNDETFFYKDNYKLTSINNISYRLLIAIIIIICRYYLHASILFMHYLLFLVVETL